MTGACSPTRWLLLQVLEMSVPVYIYKPAVRHHLNNEDPAFLMIGGLVFSVLSNPFLEATEAYTPQSPADVRLLYLMQASVQHPGTDGHTAAWSACHPRLSAPLTWLVPSPPCCSSTRRGADGDPGARGEPGL